MNILHGGVATDKDRRSSPHRAFSALVSPVTLASTGGIHLSASSASAWSSVIKRS
ncbi:hypothetical protein [uncultured Thiocystis sp.]|jgi:hypothetical protein|uniref:hypothetical protein n=1 Tax=uncultured Thiocystis sp. TaxID=1202134 RepID=UPI0025D975D2|nr:hypothetical protein [uncultured Thiocystis sp.]